MIRTVALLLLLASQARALGPEPGEVTLLKDGAPLSSACTLDLRAGMNATMAGSRCLITPGAVRLDDPKYGCVGTGLVDDTACVTAALADLAGTKKNLFIPSGFIAGVTGPAAGNFKFTVPAGASITCEDNSAGFRLVGRHCVGGSTAGAACPSASAHDCPGGTCSYDFGSAMFAPTGGSAYGLFQWATGTKANFTNCSIFAQGRDGWFTCSTAGTGHETTNACRQVCTDPSPTTSKVGAYCRENVDCGGKHCNAGAYNHSGDRACTTDNNDAVTGCPGNAQCAAYHYPMYCCTGSGTGTCGTAGASGVCVDSCPQSDVTECGTGGICKGLPGRAVGAGKVNFVDFSAVPQGGDIEAVSLWDPAEMDYGFKVGAQSFVQRIIGSETSYNYAAAFQPVVTAWSKTAQQTGVVVIVGDGVNVANGFVTCNGGPCITVRASYADVEHMQLRATGAATGIMLTGSDAQIATDSIICDNASGSIGIDAPGSSIDGTIPGGGDSQLVVNTILMCQTGVRVGGIGVNVATSTILFNANASIQIGSDGIIRTLPGHSSFVANFMGNLGPEIAIKAINPGTTCIRGSRAGETCSTDDCNGTTGCPDAYGCNGTSGSCTQETDCCQQQANSDIVVGGNSIIANTGPIIDLSALTTVGGVPILRNVFLRDNMCMGANLTNTTCIALPTDTTAAASLVVQNNNTGTASTPYTGALTSVSGRNRHSISWFIPGTATASTLYTAKGLVPTGLRNCSAVDLQFALGVDSTGTANTVNLKRCTASGSQCTSGSTTWDCLWNDTACATNVSLAAGNHSVNAGIPAATCAGSHRPWDCCTGSGTPATGCHSMLNTVLPNDQFEVYIGTVGASSADSAVELTLACDN